MRIPRLMKSSYNGAKRAYIQSAQAGCKMFLVPYPDGSRGFSSNDAGNGDTIAVYDFARDSWSYLALPHPRTRITIAAAKNKVFFAGGGSISPATHGQWFNHVDILTLEPKLQLAVNNTASTQYDFGPVLTGEEETITIDVSNEGDYDLLFEDFPMRINVTGDTEDFTIDANTIELTDTLSPTEIINLPVTFSPVTTGSKQVTISIYSNDPENPVYTYTVQGTGDESTAVKEAGLSNSLQIYPNPTSGVIHIASPTKGNLSVEIVNNQGVLMKEEKLNANNTVDISTLPEGLYFVKISNDEFSQVVKVMRK